MLKSLSALPFLLLALASCGDDNNPNRPDASQFPDSEMFDGAPPDMELPTTTHTATMSVLDVRVNGIAPLGSGGQVVVSMSMAENDEPGVVDAVGQIYDDRNSTGIGCAAYVWDLTASPPQIPPADEDHGTVTITGSTQAVPPCTFTSGDYACIATAGAGAATSAITADPSGNTALASLTVVGASFSAADVGRYVKISGATAFRNNGVFPIVNFSATPAPTLVYANSPASTQADLTGATYAVIAGAGPNPTGVDFLADDDSVTLALDAPADDEFEDFTTSPAVNVGDNFSLTPESQALISGIPLTGAEFTLGCNPSVFSHTGTTNGATFNDDAPDPDDVTITVTGIGTPNTRVGAEVTIAGATTATHNGTFTITAVGADTITYSNPAATADETFAAGTSVTINDCGNASVTALNIDFSDAELIQVYSSSTGGGSIVNDAGDDDCTLTHNGMFSAGMIGTSVTISGATTAGNDGTFTVTGSTADSVTFTNAGCATEDLVATSAYEVFDDISGVATSFLMPDPSLSHATKIGHIQCAALASQTVTVPAGASAAIMMVDPLRIRTTFVRSGLSQGTNADGTNPINVLPGHAVVGFTTP